MNTNTIKTAKISVAIVDDHSRFRNTLADFLSTHYNVNIILHADNGLELLNQLEHTVPQVVLLDIEMPVMNGVETLTRLRKSYPDLRVIMLSSYNEHSCINDLMRLGAFAYLNKGVDPDIIYQTILTALEKSA